MEEPTAQRYTFRLQWRGQTEDTSGRIVKIDGKHKLQVWMRSPEHQKIMLEVLGDADADALWPLFWRLCEYRAILPLKYRQQTPSLGPWQEVPGRPDDFREPDPRKQRDPEIQ